VESICTFFSAHTGTTNTFTGQERLRLGIYTWEQGFALSSAQTSLGTLSSHCSKTFEIGCRWLPQMPTLKQWC